MTALSIDIRDKSFPRDEGGVREVLRQVHIELQAHELVCLFGPSGCGKTTLLNIVAGLDDDFDGEVRQDGNGSDQAPRVGYVFQQPRLLPWLTVRQNLALVATDDAARGRVPALIEATGLGQHAAAFPRRLSGGQLRRVALARALVIDPDLLLLDEPFISLDLEAADRLRRHLHDLLGQRPTTALFVTHDLREAALLADRVVYLSPAPATVVGEVRIERARADRFDPAWLSAMAMQLAVGQDAAAPR